MREAELWDRARGRARWTYEDVGQLLIVIGFAAMAIWALTKESISPSVMFPMFVLAAVASWRAQRLSRRLDALVTLAQKSAAK